MSIKIKLFAIIICFLATTLAQTTKKNTSKPKEDGPLKVAHEKLEMVNDRAFYNKKPFTGISYTYFTNKRIREKTSWVNGFIEGPCYMYNENGICLDYEVWKNGLRHGEFEYKADDGNVISKGFFYEGKPDGDLFMYWRNGQMQMQKHYEQGIKHGVFKSWYKNGTLEEILIFENNKLNGLCQGFYTDSSLSYEREFKNNLFHGHEYMWHRSGCPAVERYFKNGKQDSIEKKWDIQSCEIISTGFYKNGLKHGAFIDYNANNDTMGLKNYFNGVLEGAYYLYVENSKYNRDIVTDEKGKDKVIIKDIRITRGLEEIGTYKNGKKNGYWKHGLTSKFQMREGNYDNDVQVGLWKYYDIKGKLLFTQEFNEDGELIEEKWVK